MARVLVPLDESQLAENSLPVAAAIARAQGLAVHLLSVYRSDEAFWEFAEIDPQNPIRQANESLPAYLASLATRPPLAGLTVTTEVRTGDVPEQILVAARRGDTRYVLITTRGRGGYTPTGGYGSVAYRLIRTLPVPVLVVPPVGVFGPLERMLVSLDGSPAGELALAPARELARAAGATIHLLHVVNPTMDWRITDDGMEQFLQSLAARGERYLARLAEPGETPIVLHGDPATTIVQYAHGNRCQLIAIATHGWSGPLRLELGSTADEVVRSSDRPVLLVRIPSGVA